MDSINFKYKFAFEDGQKDEFLVRIDPETLLNITDEISIEEEWTELDYNKCDHCPLNSEEHPQCPVARGMAHLVDHFKDKKSFTKAIVTVETSDRIYAKNTDLQSGLFSIFGLIMASSECPHMEFLRPMARFHLPFANLDETTLRAASTYLLKQYFVDKDGGEPDLNLKKLEKLYEAVNKVNMAMIKRIKALGLGDSDSNAIVILDSFTTIMSMEISSDLSNIRKYFD